MTTHSRARRIRRVVPIFLALTGTLLAAACGGSSSSDPNPIVQVHKFTYNNDTGVYTVVDPDEVVTTVTQDDVDRDLVGSLCGKCHEEQVDHVKDSVHFQLAAGTERIMYPGGGAHGMLDRACGLPATTGLTNSISNIGLGECAKCHVGRYLPVMEGAFATMFDQMGLPDAQQQATTLINAGIDCLVCHAENYKAHPTDAGRILADIAASATPDAASPTILGVARDSRDNADFNGDGAPDYVLYSKVGGELDTPLMMDTDGNGTPDTPWPTVAQDRSLEALASIGVTNEHTCLRCHEHARTGYKRGTLFVEGHDVHSTASTGPFEDNENQCTVCHVLPDGNHKFVRGHMVGGDLGAADFPPPPPGVLPDPNDPTDLTCTTCHDVKDLPAGIHSARHLETISCQTCHIPWGSGITYSLFGHGGHVAFGRTEDGRDTKIIAADMMMAGDKADLDADFEAFKTVPIFTWFDGGTSFLAQSLAVRGYRNARIVPFKPMANGMVFDARFFDGVMMQNDAKNPDMSSYMFNAHSMYRFFYNNDGANGDNAKAFKGLGMLDMTRDEVAKITLGEFQNPDATFDSLTMAMMQIFPNLVYFDKANFGYEHFMAPTGSPYDLTGPDGTGGPDGIIDSGTDFHFDMLNAANSGLMQFMGFNGPMGFAPAYSWYPAYGDVRQPISMKLPDGSLMKMFLGMQGMKITDEDERNAYMASIANYPAFSQVTLGGHGVLPKEQALGSSCADCHGPSGVMAHKVPVAKKELVDMGPMGQFEFPVYQWRYYKLHDLIDRGLAASSEDVADGSVDMDIHDDTTVLRVSTTEFTLNWFAAYAGMPSEYRPADDATALAGTSLEASDLTWNGGEWMPVLEPVTILTTNLEVLGYPASGIPTTSTSKPAK